MNGFLLIDKPKNITSYGAVGRIKKELNCKKCGHTGTLDPDATGLLVVGLGDATKLFRLLNEEKKTYEATLIFGYDSNTLDVYGKIHTNISMDFSIKEFDLALEELKKVELQIPPMVSAIKVKGKKLYEYERAKKEVELPVRHVKIYDLKRLGDMQKEDGHWVVQVLITCSKGFYVRSFARDLGHLLGGCAILKDLRRIESGGFHLKDATPLDQVKKARIIPIEEIFSYERLEVNSFLGRLALNGVVFDERQIKTDQPFYVTLDGEILALYEPVDLYRYKPVVIFKKEEK